MLRPGTISPLVVKVKPVKAAAAPVLAAELAVVNTDEIVDVTNVVEPLAKLPGETDGGEAEGTGGDGGV